MIIITIFIKNLQKIIPKIINFIFPPVNIELLTAGEIYSEGKLNDFKQIEDIISILDYRNFLIKEGIWELKYRGNKKIARLFSEIIYDYILDEISGLELFENFEKPILLPAPMSKLRKKEKGFNQTELLADALAILDNEQNFTVEKKVLIKIKETETQTSRQSKKERLKNLKNVFRVVNQNVIKNRNIILIDDVVTTGATISEIKSELKKNGAKKIITFTIAH